MTLSPKLFVFVAGVTMTLSGFLLFQVQPMMARYILPWFGGSATTWTVCLLFFQVSLLIGYFYAHVFTKPLKPNAQVVIHLTFIALSLFALPITPTEGLKPPDAANPTWRILALLTICVGLPYLVLSTTTPLVQKWLSSAGSATPSRLFALSNFGSFAGLISYPLLVDVYLPTDAQTTWWSTAYVVYAVLMLAFGSLVLVMSRTAQAAEIALPASETDVAARSAPGGFWLWFVISALASVSLLAVTNYITSYVSVNPFLWILPLSIYLLSYVVAFGKPGFYNPKIFGPLYAVVLAFTFFTGTDYGIDDAFAVIAVNLICFALCCMVCQGEIARRQPEPKGLTFFYLTLAAGGAAGGAFVSLVAPVVFPDYWELPLGLIGVGVLYLFLYTPKLNVAARRGASATMIAAVVLAALFALYSEFYEGGELVDRTRNFYGVLKVEELEGEDEDDEPRYAMRQAGENQGEQRLDPAERHLAACDFGPASGMALAIDYLQKRKPEGIKVGVIGLGAGMVLTYGRKEDLFRYYELNPVVTEFARKHFTFIADTKSSFDVVHGDGRLALERELKSGGSRQYDLFHLDAFRGNAPPAHLMTKESFDTYFRHLRDGGIIAVTSHNDYYDASSLLRGMADLFGARVEWIPSLTRGCNSKLGFALISRDGALFEDAKVKSRIGKWPDGGTAKIVWTDQSSSLMSLMVWSAGSRRGD